MNETCPDCLMIDHKHQQNCPTKPGKQEEVCPHCLMFSAHDSNCPNNPDGSAPPLPEEEVEPIAASTARDTTTTITAKTVWVFVLILLMLVGGVSGFFYQIGKSKAEPIPCSHNEPYQVDVKGGGVMLIVPKDHYAVPVLDGNGRPYIRPTDEVG